MFKARMVSQSGWNFFPESFDSLEEARHAVEKIVKDGGFWASEREFILLGTCLEIEDMEVKRRFLRNPRSR